MKEMEGYRFKDSSRAVGEAPTNLSRKDKQKLLKDRYPDLPDEILDDMLAEVDGDVERIIGSMQSYASSYEDEPFAIVDPLQANGARDLFLEIVNPTSDGTIQTSRTNGESGNVATQNFNREQPSVRGSKSPRAFLPYEILEELSANENNSQTQYNSKPFRSNVRSPSDLLESLDDSNPWYRKPRSNAPKNANAYSAAGASSTFGCVGRENDSDDGVKPSNENDWFDLQLEPTFAKKLFEEYSNPFGSMDVARLLPSDLNIRIPPKLAFELFRHLCLGLLEKEPENTSPNEWGESGGSTSSDDTLGISSVPWDSQDSNGIYGNDSTPDLRKIMELEMKLQGEEASKVQKIRSELQRSLAMKLTMQHLQSTFPTLPNHLLESRFANSGLKFDATVQKLKEEYPDKYCAQGLMANSQDTNMYNETVSKELQVLMENSKQNDYDGEEFSDPQELRRKATTHYYLMREYAQKRQESSHARGIASYYDEMSRLHQSAMRRYHKKASEIIFNNNNGPEKPIDQIDLHHLTVQEAMNQLDPFIRKKEQTMFGTGQHGINIRIICGRGKHSDMHGPRIWPAVINYLQRKNYEYQEGHGYVMVTIKNKNRSR